jgi:hypothetical protein
MRACAGLLRYLFHYVSENGLVYLCMADEAFGRRVPFNFLEDISKRFKTTYGDRGRTAMAYSLNDEFARVLARQMVRVATVSVALCACASVPMCVSVCVRRGMPMYVCASCTSAFISVHISLSALSMRLMHGCVGEQDYYSNASSDKLSEVKGEIAAVKEVMVQNIGTQGATPASQTHTHECTGTQTHRRMHTYTRLRESVGIAACDVARPSTHAHHM